MSEPTNEPKEKKEPTRREKIAAALKDFKATTPELSSRDTLVVLVSEEFLEATEGRPEPKAPENPPA